MATIIEEVLVCDHCSRECRTNGQTYYGGHPFSGWFSVTEHNFSTSLDNLQRKKKFDFCSAECLLSHYKASDGS